MSVKDGILKDEALKSLVCLYIAVDSDIANDVNQRVKAYFAQLERELNEANEKNKHLSKEIECLKAQLSTGDILYDKANARLKQLQEVAREMYDEFCCVDTDPDACRLCIAYDALPDDVKGKVE